MPRTAQSLRIRLSLLILSPLMVMGIVLGIWRSSVAQSTAEEVFDNSLLSAALAIARDVMITGGDLLSPSTRRLLGEASGGEVFYHVSGPGGIYLTGYAYSPVAEGQNDIQTGVPFYFESRHQDHPVRVMKLVERQEIENLAGDTVVTVWQRISDRDAFARTQAFRAAGMIGLLFLTVALVVWFGIKWGLAPLTDLQEAIAIRTPDDLSTIKRPIPIEVHGVVRTLNRLFTQLEKSIADQQQFISDAAHQLRNPAASVLAMAEALRDAPSEADRDQRTGELVEAARNSSRLAEQLLALDRLRFGFSDEEQFETFDLRALTESICAEIGGEILHRGIELELIAADQALPVRAAKLYVAEVVKILMDNAVKHGGADLSTITVETRRDGANACLTVRNDGVLLSPSNRDLAFRRFGQVSPGRGSGLGLSIAQSVAERHGGELRIDSVLDGASLTLRLPIG